MKRLNTILLASGLVFLAFLVWKVGPGELWGQVHAVGWGVALLIIGEGLANLAHTVGWRHCIRNGHGGVTTLRLFQMATAGFAINYLTPTASVGGDVSRAALLSETHTAPQAVSSVLLDKLMTALAHLLLVGGGAFFLLWRVQLPIQLWVAMAATTFLLTVGLAVFLLLQKHGKLGALCRWLMEHKLGGTCVRQMAERLTSVDEVLKGFFREHPRDLLMSIGWHVVGHSVAVFHAWAFLYLLGQPAPIGMVLAAGLLSLWFDLLTFAIPMNLGTLEGSRLVVFKALGCQALLGMAFGVAVRMAQLFWACFGLLTYARLAGRNSAAGLDLAAGTLTFAARPAAELPEPGARNQMSAGVVNRE